MVWLLATTLTICTRRILPPSYRLSDSPLKISIPASPLCTWTVNALTPVMELVSGRCLLYKKKPPPNCQCLRSRKRAWRPDVTLTIFAIPSSPLTRWSFDSYSSQATVVFGRKGSIFSRCQLSARASRNSISRE